MLRALKTLLNPKHWGPFVEAAETTGFDHGFTVSWSQGGEDLALLSYLSGIENGSYIDVGAHHPDRFSVTRHLYQRGWSGINVEANPDLLDAFNRRRPRDINLNFAVGTLPEYELTVFEEPAISTINIEWKELFERHNQKINKTLKVKGITLLELLNNYFPTKRLDLLSIDAEGSDLGVLQSLDLGKIDDHRKPKWILIETGNSLDLVLKEPHVQLLLDNKYQVISNLPMSSLFALKD